MAFIKMLPPLDGSLNVLPGFVDFHAEHNPINPWVKFPSSSQDGSVDCLTFRDFAEATHRMAHAIRPVGTARDGEVVAILINCDAILYLSLLVGLTRAGLVPFPMSPRNSPESICAMLQKTSCRKIIHNASVSTVSATVQSQMQQSGLPIEFILLPDLFTIFPSLSTSEQDTELTPYPSDSSLSGPDEIILYLHSSGSTGSPKPIPQTHRTILQWANTPIVRCGREHKLRRATPSLPTFHTMAILMQLYSPLVSGQYNGMYAPQHPAPPVVPSPQNIIEIAKLTECNMIPMVPSIIEIWAQDPEIIEFLKTLVFLGSSAGPLSEANGNKLVKAGVTLYSIYGATEFGVPTDVLDNDDSNGPDAADVKTSADWAWMRMADTFKPRWADYGDGMYELQLLTCETHQPAVENLPDAKGYATSDLWIPHPTKEGLWRIAGRTDDLVVLSSGEKIVPGPQEGFLVSLPFVTGAIIFGQGRSQAGVLIEPASDLVVDSTDEEALMRFRNHIWPYVEEANKLAQTYARVFKEMILVTHSDKPMQRAPKGTIMRKLVLQTYAEKIEALYETVEKSASSNVDHPTTWSIDEVEGWLMRHAQDINEGRDLDATADLFEQGFDSLSATFLRNRIIGAFRSSDDAKQAAFQVTQDFIFTHSSIQQLAVAVVHLVYPDRTQERPKSHVEQITDLVAKYSADFPDFTNQLKAVELDAAVVLLTGSTGNLGSHILASLLASSRVRKVFTLDRGTSPRDRLKASFKDRGLALDLLQSAKLVTLTGDLAKSDLGLGVQVLQEIRGCVTHIVHNAWKLDFNLSISSFESHIAGTRILINFCATCARPVKFLFSSSISAAQSWKLQDGSVSEDVLSDPNVAVGTGYGESKYTVEQVLRNAKTKGLDTLSVRIGQLSGSTSSGAWNVTDWVPILVKSSIALGYLPDMPGNVDWVPIDVAAQVIVDAVTSSGPLPHLINLVHPRPVPWSQVFKAVNESKNIRGNLQTIPFSEWIAKVEAHSANATEHNFDGIPAIKLLRFYRALAAASDAAPDAPGAGGRPTYHSARAQSISSILASARPIDAAGVNLWLEYWGKHDSAFAQRPRTTSQDTLRPAIRADFLE